MTSTLLSIWEVQSQATRSTAVIPDGCRDLITKRNASGQLQCFVSPLFERTKKVGTEAGMTVLGFRLQPGTCIDETALLKRIDDNTDVAMLTSILNESTRLDHNVEEALNCLASGLKTTSDVAKTLAVSTRTLQRLLEKHTGKPPSFWLQLARVRQAGRDLEHSNSLAELAYRKAYADQAHMTREFQRWFGLSPQRLLRSAEITKQLQQTGYG